MGKGATEEKFSLMDFLYKDYDLINYCLYYRFEKETRLNIELSSFFMQIYPEITHRHPNISNTLKRTKV